MTATTERAVGSAHRHATGRRVRYPPVTPDTWSR